MENYKPFSVPIPEGAEIFVQKHGKEGEYYILTYVLYREAVGSLLHLSNTTRPVISFACYLLSRCMLDPRRCHWNAAKALISYLKVTSAIGIVYKKRGESLRNFADDNFVGQKATENTKVVIRSWILVEVFHGAEKSRFLVRNQQLRPNK